MRSAIVSFVLFLPAAAEGATNLSCRSPSALDAEIAFCSDNVRAAELARECRDALVKEIHSAGPELAAIYALEKDLYANNQKKEFHVSNLDHDRAHARLTELIQLATQNLHKMAAYPPVMMDYFEEDLENPSDHAECYTKNYLVVKAAVEDIDQKIDELKRTRQVTDSLRKKISGSSANIETLKNEIARGDAALGGAAHERGASDVTGIAEDARKRRGVETAKGGGGIEPWRVSQEAARAGEAEKLGAYLAGSRGELAAAFARERESRITKAEALDSFTRQGGPRTDFGEEVSRMEREGMQLVPTNNEMAQREALSVGALIFEEGSSRQTSVRLELKKEAGLDPAPLVPSTDAGELARIEQLSPESDRAVSPAVRPLSASRESLFTMVSERYRRTELFRRARVQSIPLSAFEARLGR